MSSLVIYGNEFNGHVQNGLNPATFKYRFLAEGDSWMDRSAMFHTSLCQSLAANFDTQGDDVLVITIAMFGDTLRRMGEQARGDLRMWLQTDFPAWKFDAILLSAGGNDFIDAARNPDPGMGLLKNFAALAGTPQAPSTGHDCIKADAVAALVTGYLDSNFTALYNVVQNSRHTDVPIFLNNYDTPVARNAPAFPGGRAWLYEAYTKNSIAPALWPDLTDSIFNEVQTTIAGWAMGHHNVFSVPTDGTLAPAKASDIGSSGDWLNEIHPNRSGWAKLAVVWREAIQKVI